MKLSLLRLCLLTLVSTTAFSCTVESELEDLANEREKENSGEVQTVLIKE
ncbi:hypothetical protein [Pseudozobellia thermophila]|uniref:Uncharacterized protein n=1 Tax=Pseudozobellia thermophila TaxID=192903 RepID=A0A1M6B8W2_9FLAO|nr:hypothetical protein [Pseudozobellia thermophila]SHI45087.1 hypothetical protein SAMN04488513_101326 [Pseudozobellia thermophila]